MTMVPEQQLKHENNIFQLLRYPITQNKTLRAWTSADIYCFETAQEIAEPKENVLIINDEHGALTHLFFEHRPKFYSDSFLSNQAIKANLARNGLLDQGNVCILESMSELASNSVDLLIINLPKSYSLLDAMIVAAKPTLKNGAWVIGSGMAKHIHNNTIARFSKQIGPTHTTLAQKKSRMIVSRNEAAVNANEPAPKILDVENYGFQVVNLPGVFSYDAIDQAAFRFLPILQKHSCSVAIDLGCGNGILGGMLSKANPKLKLTCVDESKIALESTRQTFLQNGWAVPELIWSHGLANYSGPTVDTIVCNPPFHQQQTIVSDLAEQMFADAANALTPGGSFFVIGNQHLAYQSTLNRSFKVVREVFRDAKFQIFQCRR